MIRVWEGGGLHAPLISIVGVATLGNDREAPKEVNEESPRDHATPFRDTHSREENHRLLWH